MQDYFYSTGNPSVSDRGVGLLLNPMPDLKTENRMRATADGGEVEVAVGVERVCTKKDCIKALTGFDDYRLKIYTREEATALFNELYCVHTETSVLPTFFNAKGLKDYISQERNISYVIRRGGKALTRREVLEVIGEDPEDFKAEQEALVAKARAEAKALRDAA
jgi:hypothetical protein